MPPALYVPFSKNFPLQAVQSPCVVSEPPHVHEVAPSRHQHVPGPAHAWHSGELSSLRCPAGHGPVGSWLGLALGLVLGELLGLALGALVGKEGLADGDALGEPLGD